MGHEEGAEGWGMRREQVKDFESELAAEICDMLKNNKLHTTAYPLCTV